MVIWQEVAVTNIFLKIPPLFSPMKLKGTAQKADRLEKLTFVKVIIECLMFTKHISNNPSNPHPFGLTSLRKSGKKG